MNIGFPVEQTVKKRYSVRTYQEKKPITEEDKEKLMTYANALSNPFGVHVSFHLLETTEELNTQKLGTYGVIKGADTFLGATVPAGQFSLEAVGYDFERLMLYATHLGIGTCWLAATINRSAFAAAIGVKDNELFPAVSPIGYAAERKSMTESLFRKTLKSDQRKDRNELFFLGDFSTPLREKDAEGYAFPLEMLRLAPSARNQQPWRVVQSNGVYHFYAEADWNEKEENRIVIQRVDVGIGASHFHLAALEKGLSGKFEKLNDVNIAAPKELQYIFSWISENA